MAKFDLKFSNIVKVVLVILLVVGLYNLVYNSNVFNYSMYEGFTSEQIPKILDNAIDMYNTVADFADKASKLSIDSDIKPLVDTLSGTFDHILNSNDLIYAIIKTFKDNLDDNTKQIIRDIENSLKLTKYYAGLALDKASDLNDNVKTTIKEINTYKTTKTPSELDKINSDIKKVTTELTSYKDALADVVKNANIVVNKLKDLKTSMQVSKESFDNLYPSKDDQSINCSLMQPYASYKCGPINPAKFFFDNIEFKPDCCPSTYSSSQGCACLCPQQINYLNSRGGNRTFPTQF